MSLDIWYFSHTNLKQGRVYKEHMLPLWKLIRLKLLCKSNLFRPYALLLKQIWNNIK